MKISELLDSIRKQDTVLPEFQREYVWKRDQAKKLIDSLIKGYPVGGLLFWKTDEPPALKNVKSLPEKLGTIDVILDGQQRLTTLYMLLEGEIPPFYTKIDIESGEDPRNLYYNLDSGDLLYYKPKEMKDNPIWLRVVDCFNDSIEHNFVEMVKFNGAEEGQYPSLMQKYIKNLTRLQNIKSIRMPIQMVPSEADLTDAITVFDLVNRQGTKLTDADLALTHITGKWAQARRIMKDKIDALNEEHFYFDLTFMTRALTGVVEKRGLLETIHDTQKDKLEEGWERLSKILDYMVKVLPAHASVHSNYDLNSSNVLVPLIVFLSLNNGKFANDVSIKHATNWLYAAHIWARYSAQTTQKLEFDISLVVRNESPWEALIEAIIDQRGRIDVKPSDLEGRTAQHPLYRMMHILSKAQGAVDWFNGAPIATPYNKSGWIQSHHIFPTSRLYEHSYDSENHLHKKIVNEIANRAFITGVTNREISNKLPEDYLPEVEERFPGSLEKQFIPMDPSLWKMDRYPEFLDARRNLISIKLNEFMSSLITEPEIVHKRSIGELIDLGESATLEFKSSLQWDLALNKKNNGLRKSVLKTIAAFLNSSGGTLVIGVEDDGNVYGLENDLNTLNKSIDKFANLLATLITDYIGPEFSEQIKIRFETLNGSQVCVVDVDQSLIPAYLRGDKGSEFYNRFGPTSRMLDSEETVSYINMHWT
jgi:hypothetical protein